MDAVNTRLYTLHATAVLNIASTALLLCSGCLIRVEGEEQTVEKAPQQTAADKNWTPGEFLYTPADITAMRKRLEEESDDGPLHHLLNRGKRWPGTLKEPGYLERLLPEGLPIHSSYPVGKCPACRKGSPAWQGRSNGNMVCAKCGTLFPNEKYPDTESMDLGGRLYRYARDENGNPSHISGNARYWQTIWTMKHDRPHQQLAIAYLLTGDKRFARAAADIIIRYSENWLKWPMLHLRRDETGLPRPATLDMMKRRSEYYGKLQWLDDSILLSHVAFAYGAIRNSEVLSEKEHMLIRDLARETLELNTFPHLYYRKHSFGNMHGTMYTAMIMTGRAFGMDIVCRDVLFNSFELNGVDLIHEAYDGPKGVVYACANECDREGSHREASPSYYRMMAAMFLQALVFVKDYKEPAGYTPLDKVSAYYRGGRKLDPGREAYLHRLLGYYSIANSHMRMPPLNDSDAVLNVDWDWFLMYYLLAGNDESRDAARALQPQPATVSEHGIQYYPTLKAVDYQSVWTKGETGRFPIFSGVKDNVGLAVLRGAGQTDLYMNWDGHFASHIQYEQMGLILYAKGCETLMDFGYQGSSYWLRSRWTNRTIAHNTVTVDESVNCSVPRGQLEHWIDTGAVRIVQASDSKAFPGLTRFRRTVALIDIDADHSYCLDLFEVHGGKRHDQSWIVNGQLKRLDDVRLAPRKGTLLGENTEYKDIKPVPGVPHSPQPGAGQMGNGYGFIHKLSVGPCTGETWTAEWDIENSPMNLRILGIPSADDVLVRGMCPFERVRPNKRTEENNDEGKQGPIVIVRRKAEGEAVASSCLAVAIEPYDDAPQITSVRRVTREKEQGIEARLGPNGQRRDMLLVGNDGSVTYTSREGEQLRELIFMGKDRWSEDGWEVTFEDSHCPGGNILTVNGENLSLLVDLPLPAGRALAGHLIRATKPSGLRSHFLIKRVKKEGKRFRVFIDKRSGSFARNIGLVDEIVDAHTFVSGTYFTSSESWGQIYKGDSILIGAHAHTVEKVEYLGREKRFRMKVTLADDAFPDKNKQGEQFILSAVAPGERWQINFPAHITSVEGNRYQVHCPVDVSVRAP